MDKLVPLFFDLSFSEIDAVVRGWNQPAFRSLQLWQNVYRQLWISPEEFSNFPLALRQQCAELFRFSSLQPVTIRQSADARTVKTLFNLSDDNQIEAVLMKYNARQTLCISTQAGCALGCQFCATGQGGFKRNLSTGEIVEQVLYYARLLKQQGKEVTNIVVMGMGEPFLNYEATLAAIDRLNDPEGTNFGERRFTISTAGIIPGILRFADEQRQINIAISLHAANDALRSTLMPINRKYPLKELISACDYYIRKTHRRLSFEWALISQINDSLEHALELANLIRGLLAHVNLIPLNPTTQYAGGPSSKMQAQKFQDILKAHGIPCTIRLRRGIDISAGCGQLVAEDRKNQLPI